MGNQVESNTKISNYYKDLIEKQQLKRQPQSLNKLKPTPKLKISQSISSAYSLKSISKRMFLDEPQVNNPLQRLKKKKQEGNISQNFEELIRNMVKHQDSITLNSNKTKQSQEYTITCDTPLFCEESRPRQFHFGEDKHKQRTQRAKSFQNSFKNMINKEDLNQSQQALQFILNNCTQTVSRTNIEKSANITFDSLESDYPYPNKIPQINNNNNDKLFELSTSNIMESVRLNSKTISRKTSCNETIFQAPQETMKQNDSLLNHPEEQWIKHKNKLEYKKIMMILDGEQQENILIDIHNKENIQKSSQQKFNQNKTISQVNQAQKEFIKKITQKSKKQQQSQQQLAYWKLRRSDKQKY